jgi:hypothetical protein
MSTTRIEIDVKLCETLEKEILTQREEIEVLRAALDEARRIAEAYRTVWESCAAAVETCPNPDPLPWNKCGLSENYAHSECAEPRPEHLAI